MDPQPSSSSSFQTRAHHSQSSQQRLNKHYRPWNRARARGFVKQTRSGEASDLNVATRNLHLEENQNNLSEANKRTETAFDRLDQNGEGQQNICDVRDKNYHSRRGRAGRSSGRNENRTNMLQNQISESNKSRTAQTRVARAANPRYLNQARTHLRHESRSIPVNELTTLTSIQDDPHGTEDALNVQSEIAEGELKSNSFECMICCDTIHRSNSIWYCDKCYNIFHLKCAIEWCNKSIKSRNEAITVAQYPSLNQTSLNQVPLETPNSLRHGYSDYQNQRLDSVEWPCPTCREVLHSKPGKYKCFCGKVVRPEINRHLTPHSCGQLCGRKRPNFECPHTCNSICHPGRCAPCPLTCRRTCFCGKSTKEVKCATGPISCEEVCGKPFLCGKHSCSKSCHQGSCGTCTQVLTLKCNCGQQEVQRLCIELSETSRKASITNFSCDKVCGKLLTCGNHNCIEKCHPGPHCPTCKLLSENIKTCPCGSTLIKKSLLLERKSCIEPIPTCESKCNRLLVCGPEKNHHRCQKKCHTGPCPPCKLKTPVRCECKLSTKTIECAIMYKKTINGEQVHFEQVEYSFTCETRCNKLKNCGRHRCNNKCCRFLKTLDSSIHRCDQMCNKKLACGQHNCLETCHLGACGDCTNIGWEELTCHCGASVLYPPIPCASRAPVCHRPCRRAHNCGHPVKHECHDETETCAPCTVFVKKSCFCGGESKESVYCYLQGYSCGRTCKKELVCRQHHCKRVCHDGECESPNERGVILCTQQCPVARYSCKHPCGLPCHGKTACPSSVCKKAIEVTCECGNKKDRVECHKVRTDVDNMNKLAMLSMNRSNQDSITIDLSRKPIVDSSSAANNNEPIKKLDCDETCSILKRNKALAEALDIAQPDLKPVSIFGEDPLRLLKEATAQDYKFVSGTYTSLVKLIKSAKESDKRFIFIQFPPADKLRRETIHELAHHFNCTSESRDEEPFKHVVVRAYKNKSCVPDFNIEQLLPIAD